jgi:hypothetical protein
MWRIEESQHSPTSKEREVILWAVKALGYPGLDQRTRRAKVIRPRAKLAVRLGSSIVLGFPATDEDGCNRGCSADDGFIVERLFLLC